MAQLRPIVSHQRWVAIHSLTIASPESEQQGEGVSGASAPTEEMETTAREEPTRKKEKRPWVRIRSTFSKALGACAAEKD